VEIDFALVVVTKKQVVTIIPLTILVH
jgi:hypothetical protein